MGAPILRGFANDDEYVPLAQVSGALLLWSVIAIPERELRFWFHPSAEKEHGEAHFSAIGDHTLLRRKQTGKEMRVIYVDLERRLVYVQEIITSTNGRWSETIGMLRTVRRHYDDAEFVDVAHVSSGMLVHQTLRIPFALLREWFRIDYVVLDGRVTPPWYDTRPSARGISRPCHAVAPSELQIGTRMCGGINTHREVRVVHIDHVAGEIIAQEFAIATPPHGWSVQ